MKLVHQLPLLSIRSHWVFLLLWWKPTMRQYFRTLFRPNSIQSTRKFSGILDILKKTKVAGELSLCICSMWELWIYHCCIGKVLLKDMVWNQLTFNTIFRLSWIKHLFFICHWFAMSNGCWNPFIYALFSVSIYYYFFEKKISLFYFNLQFLSTEKLQKGSGPTEHTPNE